MENVANNNDGTKFTRLFILQCVLISIMFLAIVVAFFERPKEVFPMFVCITVLLAFWFAYFYMTYFLGKRGFIKYSPFIFLKYFEIPTVFLKQTKNLPHKYFFYVYIVSLCLLVLGGAWLWFH